MLDNDLWLDQDGVTFPEEVRQHCRDHPRLLATRGTLGAQPEAAWETTPTTVLIGERDDLLSEADLHWAEEHVDDVRVIGSIILMRVRVTIGTQHQKRGRDGRY